MKIDFVVISTILCLANALFFIIIYIRSKKNYERIEKMEKSKNNLSDDDRYKITVIYKWDKNNEI